VDIPYQLFLIDNDVRTMGTHTLESSTLYWSLIFNLVSSGRLRAAINIIAKHSLVSNNTGAATSEGKALAALTELFHNHPYAAYVSGAEDNTEDDGMMMMMDNAASDSEEVLARRLQVEDLTSKLLAWQDACRRVRLQYGTVFSNMGMMMPVLALLETGSCDANAELNIAECVDWRTYTTMKLLYSYAPPLSRSDISTVMEQAIEEYQRLSRRTMNPREDTIEEVQLKQAFLSTLRGDIGPSLREFFQFTESLYAPHNNGATNAQLIAPSLALMALLSTGHLTFLLSRTAGLVDLLSPLPDSSYGCDLGEEVLLQAAQRLHELDYPVDVMVGYLKSCPSNGIHVAAALLPRTVVRNDEAALRLVTLLRELNLHDEALSVCRIRYSYWLAKETR
jgi:hypothetical protein